MRFKVWRGINTDEVAEPNVFACVAATAAFTGGGEWLDELRGYLAENKKIAREYIKKEIPVLHVVESHATYLMWIDISGWDYKKCDVYVEGEKAGDADPAELSASDVLRRKTGLFLSDGAIYGGNGGKFLRMNLACPRATVLEGLDRLKQAVKE